MDVDSIEPEPKRVRWWSRRWARRVRSVLYVVLGVAALGAFLTYRWFFAPPSKWPKKVDGVVVLAGGFGERLDAALKDEGAADVLIVNEGIVWTAPESESVHQLCATGSPDFEVVCLRSLPDSTRGEAITMSQIAEDRGMKTIAIVTTDHHVSRSLRWFHRCFDGEVIPVSASGPTSQADIEHEWLGVLEQLTFERSCE
jgi:uncharacterized SAM-binding protein YcdF (DUF218 family)